MAISTFKRYERKYLVDGDTLQKIMPTLLEYMDSDPYCIGGKEYRIYSVYYDTPNHDVIRQNSSKPVYKEKMRVRSYYEHNEPDEKVFMELKKKNEGVGNKRRIKLRNREIAPFINEGILPETKDYLSAQVAKELQYFLKMNPVQPALYVQYDRMAFFGKEDKNFRMTFDRNLRTRRSNFTLGESEEDEFLLPENTYIMEVKILGAMPLWLTHLLSEYSLFSRGFSKYGARFKSEAAQRLLVYHLYDEQGNEVDFDYFEDKETEE